MSLLGPATAEATTADANEEQNYTCSPCHGDGPGRVIDIHDALRCPDRVFFAGRC